jgi:hypothetical protein
VRRDDGRLSESAREILNYFQAERLISSGVVEGLNNKAKVTMRKSSDFAPTECSNWHSITHLASCPNPNQPTIFSDEPKNKLQKSTICFT